MKTTTQLKPTPPAAMPAPAPAPLPLAAAPDWLTETPDETRYSLDMEDTDSLVVQEVPVTRAEFVALKQHLAGLRGIIPVLTAAEPAAAPVATAQLAPAAAPLDPLRGVQNFYDLEQKQPKEAQALRAQLLDQIMRSLPKMPTAQVQEVAQFLDLCANDRGCLTPVEAFITGLVNTHYLFGGLTPEGVMDDFEGQDGFKVNYEESIENMERFNVAYKQRTQAPAA